MDIVEASSQQFEQSQGFEGTEVSATQLDITDIEIPLDDGPLSLPQPFARLLSFSAGVAHINMMPNGVVVDGMMNKYSFGRSKKKCDFTFEDQRISSMHCIIYTQDVTVGGVMSAMVFVRDESANGTFVNGARVGRGLNHALRDGDELSLIKPEPGGDISDWDKARFIVKLPDAAIEPLIIGIGTSFGAVGGVGDDSGAIRKRLGTISKLLQQERVLQEHYQIVRPIGEGAHGQVYLAFDKKVGREWAVKFIDVRRASLGGGSAVSTILKEAEIMKNLHHKHIVNLEDVFADGVNIYLVMELLSGGDLFDRVVKKSKYAEKDALDLMYQLLDAMAYLHAKGIAHRDLKLENIMLISQDNDVDIKITDFGLAKTSGKLKTFCGTPNYYSPEVLQRRHTIRGEGSYSVAADMWSCGVIMYVLLSGEMPWRGHDIDRCIRDAKYTPMIGKKWIAISAEAKALIKALLEPNPEARLTVDQAIAHPWFSSRVKSTHATLDGPSSLDSRKMSIDSSDSISGHSIRTGISKNLNDITLADKSYTTIKSVVPNEAKSKKRKLSETADVSFAEEKNQYRSVADKLKKRHMIPRKCKSELEAN